MKWAITAFLCYSVGWFVGVTQERMSYEYRLGQRALETPARPDTPPGAVTFTEDGVCFSGAAWAIIEPACVSTDAYDGIHVTGGTFVAKRFLPGALGPAVVIPDLVFGEPFEDPDPPKRIVEGGFFDATGGPWTPSSR